jgi:endonuclease/exonuclease/phosphatase family metal-dependent hydrolase
LKPPGWIAALVAAFAAFPLPRAHAADPAEIVFAGYNLEDYFQSSDFPDGREKVSKSPEAIAAEIRVIQDIHPDIIGVCEMGPPNEFADFQARLKAAGLDYPNSEYVQGPDPERHVALLSKFPIVSRQSLPDVPFQLDGREEKAARGFLDVTISIGTTQVRFIGVHLKSKLKDTVEDEEDLRRNEAHLLRQHIDQVLATPPAPLLVVYGDFNDTKNSPSLKEITGPRGSSASLRDLWLKDDAGDHWTEYWDAADVYTRIDYILVTRNLLPAVDLPHSYIYRSPYWNLASDHRAVVAALRLNKVQ